MTYFGTGETFLFTLSPCSRAYHWDHADAQQQEPQKPQAKKKMSHYVFVDTIPLIKDSEDSSSSKKTQVKKTRKVSMKRRISKSLSKPGFDRSVSRSAYSNRDKLSVSLHPLSAINKNQSSYSVPKKLVLGNKSNALAGIPENHSAPANLKDYGSTKKKLVSAQTIDIADMKKLQKSSNVVIDDSEVDGQILEKFRSYTEGQKGSSGGARPKLNKESIIEEEDEENFHMIEEKNAPPKIGSPPSSAITTSEGDQTKKRLALFISCDDNRIVVGGG